jgi:hypothetical protein
MFTPSLRLLLELDRRLELLNMRVYWPDMPPPDAAPAGAPHAASRAAR